MNSMSKIGATLLLAVTLSGCGGGGGGGGGSSLPLNSTIEATVDFSANDPAVGYLVNFGSKSPLPATTNAEGQFEITFTTAQYSGSQPLIIYDNNGNEIDTQPVQVAGGTQNLGTITVGPPAPPPAARIAPGRSSSLPQ